mmetsp:Transcript_13972/g.25616  ORF Transcript_13972/g.25616 Transcript_13972/m.25616 type:complete len:406 (-) Transcript_13972:133-1350(-)
MKLEVCCTSSSCCSIALESGAAAVELCSALSCGGLTPSVSAVSKVALLHSDYPTAHITVLVRPRPSDFVYTPSEKDLIISDVKAFASLGVHSVTVGCLTPSLHLDSPFLKRITELGVEVTLHRCVDDVLAYGAMSPESLVDEAATSGVSRILTSGGEKLGLEGMLNISKMVEYAKEHYPLMTIVACGGIDEDGIGEFKEKGVEFVHVGSSVMVVDEVVNKSPLFHSETKIISASKVSSLINKINNPTTPSTSKKTYADLTPHLIEKTVLKTLEKSNDTLTSKESGIKIHLSLKPDVPEIINQIVGLAVYEKVPDALNVTRSILEVDGFGSERQFYCLLLRDEVSGEGCGFAFFYFAYSTWEGRVLYLEDLYIEEEGRYEDAGGGCEGVGVQEVRLAGVGLEHAGD